MQRPQRLWFLTSSIIFSALIEFIINFITKNFHGLVLFKISLITLLIMTTFTALQRIISGFNILKKGD